MICVWMHVHSYVYMYRHPSSELATLIFEIDFSLGLPITSLGFPTDQSGIISMYHA